MQGFLFKERGQTGRIQKQQTVTAETRQKCNPDKQVIVRAGTNDQ